MWQRASHGTTGSEAAEPSLRPPTCNHQRAAETPAAPALDEPALDAVQAGGRAVQADYQAITFVGGWGASLYQYA